LKLTCGTAGRRAWPGWPGRPHVPLATCTLVRACDVLLMTSTFEGVPTPSTRRWRWGSQWSHRRFQARRAASEQRTGTHPGRSDARAYAEPARSSGRSREAQDDRYPAAEAGHRPVLAGEMGSDHGSLYDELLASRGRPDAPVTRPHDRRRRTTECAPSVPHRRRDATSFDCIPCFNHGPYLLECLESISHQTYPHVDVIVIDDASTDPETLRTSARSASALTSR